jgi:plasmid stabilization system protein ParE
MKIRVLRSALEDLASARQFYDAQAPGVGDYFFDSLFSEIDSLVLHAGIHRAQFGFHRQLARRFPFAIYYRVTGSGSSFFVCWTAVVILERFGICWRKTRDLFVAA